MQQCCRQIRQLLNYLAIRIIHLWYAVIVAFPVLLNIIFWYNIRLLMWICYMLTSCSSHLFNTSNTNSNLKTIFLTGAAIRLRSRHKDSTWEQNCCLDSLSSKILLSPLHFLDALYVIYDINNIYYLHLLLTASAINIAYASSHCVVCSLTTWIL